MSRFGQCEAEMSIQIIYGPRNVHTCPMVGNAPVSIKKTGAIYVLEMLEQILVGYPEQLVQNQQEAWILQGKETNPIIPECMI